MVKLTIQTMLTNQANASFQKILIQSMHFIMYNMTGKINSTHICIFIAILHANRTKMIIRENKVYRIHQ